LRVPNLLASDDPAVDCLSERLADKALFHGLGLDQIENRPQRASELKALRRLCIAIGQAGIMQYGDAEISLLRRKSAGTIMWSFAGFRSDSS